jgi:hypothetical protein
MKTCVEERLAIATIALGRSQDWVHHVISLLDAVDEAIKALLADSMHTFHRVNTKTIKGRLLSRRTVGLAHGGSVFVGRSSWAM